MAESSKVYDILYPNPPSLEQLSAVSMAQILWRHDISKRREGPYNEMEYVKNILRDNLRSKLPLTIFRCINACNNIMDKSLKRWWHYHWDEFTCTFIHKIPDGFVDYVCNLDGTIHYGKTARRLIGWDRMRDNVLKFKIACLYCLEDEVYRLWPLVSSRVRLREGFDERTHECSLTNFWIRRLTGESFEYSYAITRKGVIGSNLSSIEYFWNYMSSKDQLYVFDHCYDRNNSSRYLLPKLDEGMLKTVVHTEGVELISRLLRGYENHNEPLALAIWTYIKDEMSPSSFVQLVREISPKIESNFSEIWLSASHPLKQAAIQDLLHNSSEYGVRAYYFRFFRPVDFLLAILSDASIVERNRFWRESWLNFAFDISPADLQRLTNLCFSDDQNEILRFKENCMCKYENIGDHCGKLLNERYLSLLNEFLSYCCPDESTTREVCSKVLRHKFKLNARHVEYADDSNEFINNAFESIDLATEFKNQLLVSPETMSVFETLLNGRCFNYVSEFVDTLKASEEITLRVKNEVIELTVGVMQANGDVFSVSHSLKPFLEWCFVNNNDGVVRFRQMFRVSEVVQAVTDVIRRINSDMERKSYSDFSRKIVTSLEVILKWCFETDEAFEEFRSDPSNELLFKLIEENSELYNKWHENE